jgi:hypothetical protein
MFYAKTEDKNIGTAKSRTSVRIATKSLDRKV